MAPTSILHFPLLFLHFYCPSSIPQVHFLFDRFLNLFLSLSFPHVRTLPLGISLMIYTVFLFPFFPLPCLYILSFLLTSFCLLPSLLPFLTTPGAQLWPLVTLQEVPKWLIALQGVDLSLCSFQISLRAENSHVPPHHLSLRKAEQRLGEVPLGPPFGPRNTHAEETLTVLSLDVGHGI